jgi:predicted transposase/invertase (TIGR01784 family)
MYFFNGTEETSSEDLAKIIGSDVIIERAYHELDRYYWNETELLSYEQAEKYEGAYNASIRQAIDDGEQIGIAKTKKEALEEKKEIAGKMLKKGIDREIVRELTGFSVDELDR